MINYRKIFIASLLINIKCLFMRKIILFLFSFFSYLGASAQIGIIEGLNSTTLPTGWTTSSFAGTTATPCEGSHSWRINFYSDYDEWFGEEFGTVTGSLTSPNLTAASNGTDIEVSFEWKANEYSAGFGVGFTFLAEYSLNNGTNWIQIGSPIVADSNTSCDTFSHTIPGTDVPSGSNFRFRVRGNWSAGDSYLWIDAISVTQETSEAPACTTLTNPANGAINISSGLISWNVPNGIPTGYKLKVGTAPGGSQIVNNEDVGAATSYDLGNLIAGTTYYATVTPYNLNGDAAGCVETSFTACGSFSDFTEGFETTSMPNCWYRKYDSTSASASVATSTTYAKTGTRSLAFYNAGDAAAKLYAVTPILTALENGTHRIKFSVRGSANTSIEVGTMSDPNDDTTFSSLQTFTTTTSFQDFAVNFDSQNSDQHIAFRANFGSAYTYVYLDDVAWESIPSCPDVTALAYADVTSDTATLAWEPGGSEAAWQYAIGISTVTDPETLTAVEVTGGNPSAEATDLAPNTTYKFWIRANCGAGSFGAWIGPVSFKTLCVAEAAPTAVQTFETEVPGCWTEATGVLAPSVTLAGTSSAWGAATAFANATGSTNKAVRINLYGTKNDWFISNAIDLGNNAGDYRVSYRMAVTSYNGTTIQPTLGTHKVSVIVSADGGETWSDADVIRSYTGAANYSNVGQTERIDLSAYSGIVKIAFVATTTSTSLDLHFHIDDFSVEALPACADVFNLSYADVTDATATINWETNGSETAWQYAIGDATATDPATLTAVDVTGGNPTAVIPDLDPTTTYKFWIRANCGAGSFGGWNGPVSFTTACAPFDDFTEGFETTPTGTVMPNCWYRKYVSTTTFTSVTTSAAYAKTGTRSLSFYNAGDAAAKLYAVTPVLNALENGTHRIKFSVRGSAGTSIEVGTMSDPNDDTTFSLLETFPTTTSFQDFAVNFDSPNSDQHIAFRANFGSTYTYVYLDDVAWELIPSCPDVTALAYADVTSDTAALTWEPGGSETAWQYAIDVSTVTDPETLTAVEVTGGNPSAGVADLTPNTTYKFWVRANCGAGSFGAWIGPVSFKTLCVAETAPTAVQTFETEVPGCWAEATGALAPSVTLAGTSSAWGAAAAFANATGSTNKAVRINLYGTKNDWFISNAIDLGDTPGAYRVSYRMAVTYYNTTAVQPTLGSHKVSVIVSADGGETWSDADVIRSYTGAGSYSNIGQMERIDLSAYSGVVKIAFVATTTSTADDIDSHFHIDDFSVEPIPACVDVFNLGYADVTSSSATINWETNGTETAWQYAIGDSTATDPATLTAVDVTGGNPTAEVTDLTSNTTHKFWIRSNCGAGSFGGWNGPVSFTTSCEAFSIPSTLENFDGTTGTALPGCWSTALVSGTTAWTGMTPGTTGDITSTVSGTRIVAKAYSSSDALLVSTPFDYTSITEATNVNLYLHRHASAAVADKYTVYVNTNPTLTGAETILEVYSKTNIEPTVSATGFYNYTAAIPQSFNGEAQVYIIIQGYTNNGFSSYTLGVDDFKVEYTEDLKNPSVEAAAFTLYPNPVKDVLNISYTQNITNVEVFNMLGQQILAKSVNATEGKVDMSNLASGTYLVRVAADNQVKTIKIIKQ